MLTLQISKLLRTDVTNNTTNIANNTAAIANVSKQVTNNTN